MPAAGHQQRGCRGCGQCLCMRVSRACCTARHPSSIGAASACWASTTADRRLPGRWASETAPTCWRQASHRLARGQVAAEQGGCRRRWRPVPARHRWPTASVYPSPEATAGAHLGMVALGQPALHPLQARVAFTGDHLHHQRALWTLPLQRGQQPAWRRGHRPGRGVRPAASRGAFADASRTRLRPALPLARSITVPGIGCALAVAAQCEQAQRQPAAARTPH